MAVDVRAISSKKEIKQFIQFANDLYKDCPYYCPPLFLDEMAVFDRSKNPAMDFSDFQLFLAYKNGKIVGRIAALINRKANEAWNVKHVRFGWMDFIDDLEVSHALLDAVADWGKKQGMTEMNGPVGFTDWDHEGLLLEGYDYVAPLASLYNYPYYVRHMDAYGLTKDADWVEMLINCPKEVPDKMARVAKIVQERSHVHVDKVKNAKELVRKYGNTFMDVLDEAYQKLYNFQPMTERQKLYYRDIYFPILNFDFVTIIVNEKDEIVGVGLGMPDISDAVRRCGGKLFPFGWFYILRALKAKHMKHFDLLLVAVRPDYQDKGINSLFFADQIPYFNKYGVQTLDTTSILETNTKNQQQFQLLEHKYHKRRRAYIKSIA